MEDGALRKNEKEDYKQKETERKKSTSGGRGHLVDDGEELQEVGVRRAGAVQRQRQTGVQRRRHVLGVGVRPLVAQQRQVHAHRRRGHAHHLCTERERDIQQTRSGQHNSRRRSTKRHKHSEALVGWPRPPTAWPRPLLESGSQNLRRRG